MNFNNKEYSTKENRKGATEMYVKLQHVNTV